jgi:hypothetical protein
MQYPKSHDCAINPGIDAGGSGNIPRGRSTRAGPARCGIGWWISTWQRASRPCSQRRRCMEWKPSSADGCGSVHELSVAANR